MVRLVGQGFVGKFMVVPEHVEGAIEPEADGDFGAGRRERHLGTEELEVLSMDSNGPIIVDVSVFLEAEDIVEVDAIG